MTGTATPQIVTCAAFVSRQVPGRFHVGDEMTAYAPLLCPVGALGCLWAVHVSSTSYRQSRGASQGRNSVYARRRAAPQMRDLLEVVHDPDVEFNPYYGPPPSMTAHVAQGCKLNTAIEPPMTHGSQNVRQRSSLGHAPDTEILAATPAAARIAMSYSPVSIGSVTTCWNAYLTTRK